jgi:uncharacterized Tic20 family protein
MCWAGAALGPIAWGINLQTIYAIAPRICGKSEFSAYMLTLVLVFVSLAGTFISVGAIRSSAGSDWVDAQGGRPRNFVSWIGAGTGVLFALVIANQFAAALMINPCLH